MNIPPANNVLERENCNLSKVMQLFSVFFPSMYKSYIIIL